MAPRLPLYRSAAQAMRAASRTQRFMRPASSDSPSPTSALSTRTLCNSSTTSYYNIRPFSAITPGLVSEGNCCSTQRAFSSASRYPDISTEPVEKEKRGKRVWKANPGMIDSASRVNEDEGSIEFVQSNHWGSAVDDVNDRRIVDESLARICEQVWMCLSSFFVAYCHPIFHAFIFCSGTLDG